MRHARRHAMNIKLVVRTLSLFLVALGLTACATTTTLKPTAKGVNLDTLADDECHIRTDLGSFAGHKLDGADLYNTGHFYWRKGQDDKYFQVFCPFRLGCFTEDNLARVEQFEHGDEDCIDAADCQPVEE